jgi:hypothetical protein
MEVDIMDTDFWPEKVVIIDDLQQSIQFWEQEIKNLDWIKNFKSEFVSEPVEEVKKLAHENKSIFSPQDRCNVYEIESEEQFNKAKTFLNNTENAIVWLDLNLHQPPNADNKLLHSYYKETLHLYFNNDDGGDYKTVSMLDTIGGCILALEFKPIFNPPILKLLVVVSGGPLPREVMKKMGNEEAIAPGAYSIRGSVADARNAIVAGLNRWVELRNRNLLDMFWTETNEWFSGKSSYPHDWNDRQKTRHTDWPSIFKKTLERYLGPLPADWFEDDTGHYAHETLKTLCGNNSILGNGQGKKPISTFAAYLIFLMGAHSKLKEMHIEEASLNNAKNIQWNVSNKEQRFIEVLKLFSTYPDTGEHKKAAKCLFRLGSLLATHKSNNNVTLKTPFWTDETLTLSIPLSLGSNSTNFLKDAKEALSPNYSSHFSNNKLETSVMPNLIQLSKCKVWNGQSGKIILEHSIHNDNIICIHLKPSTHQFVVIGDTRGETKDE